MKASHFNKIYPIFIVSLMLIISISLLVTSEAVTRAVMESRQDQETLELLQGIFPEATFYTFDMDTEIYTLYNNGRNDIGYAFYGEGRGFNIGMVILIGLKNEETIKDIIVVSQRETKWYWDRVVSSDFFDQFNELNIENCILKRYNNDGIVDKVTGATFSCGGVVDIVRETSLEKIEYLN